MKRKSDDLENHLERRIYVQTFLDKEFWLKALGNRSSIELGEIKVAVA
jgi:hypothetical protein